MIFGGSTHIHNYQEEILYHRGTTKKFELMYIILRRALALVNRKLVIANNLATVEMTALIGWSYQNVLLATDVETRGYRDMNGHLDWKNL